MALLCNPKLVTHFLKLALPVIDKQKQGGSISAEHTELKAYIAGKRVAPDTFTTRITINKDADEATATTRDFNFIWILPRQSNVENAKIPSWIGFNIHIRNYITITQDILFYLLTINAPATVLTPASESLNQYEAIRTD